MPTLVIDGHPRAGSLTAALARAYADAHPDARLLALRDLEFDPVLRCASPGEQPLEPDLVAAAELLRTADHVVVATPVWWSSTPALLRGFLDRVLQAGWAYTYRDHRPVGLLSGRTGRLLVTADSPGWYLRLLGSPTVRQLRTGTLRFVGLSSVEVTRFNAVRTSDATRRSTWLASVADLAGSDAAASRRRTTAPADPGPLVLSGATSAT